jgi:hypothetical protein
LRDCYPPDADHLRQYCEMAATEDGFRGYLRTHVEAKRVTA